MHSFNQRMKCFAGWLGLLGEHVPETELARSAAGIQSDADERQVDSDTAWRRQLGSHLGPRHVPTQRKTCQLPRSDSKQQAVATKQHRIPLVRHQVSINSYDTSVHRYSLFIILSSSVYLIIYRLVPEIDYWLIDWAHSPWNAKLYGLYCVVCFSASLIRASF